MMNGVVAKNKNLRLISRDGKNIVVDKESGSWALLPKKIINILQDIDDKVEVSEFLEKFNISEKEFIGLYKANMFLINGKQYFDYSIYDTYIKKYPSLGVIHITSDCNLRCKYCFANCESGISISEEQIKKTIDAFLNLPNKNITIDFHGGEPLLAFKKIKKAVEYANKRAVIHDKNIRFVLQTNGTLLNDEKLKFIKENKIDIGLSFDGPKSIHDRNRFYPNQKGSFNEVMRAVKLLRKYDMTVKTATVITNTDEMEEIFDFFVSNKIYRMKFMLCHNQGRGENCEKPDQIEFAKNHLKILDKAIEFNKLNGDKIKLTCLAPIINNITTFGRNWSCMNSPCGAGSQNIAVGEDGRILPCDYMFGCKDEKKFILGNIN
ncbi:MAG: radical SAM protein [Clostridium sp.]|nr:radical SAM protein [Clostridium sp.]